MKELDKKTSVDIYERAAKDLPIYQEFMEFKKRSAAPILPPPASVVQPSV
jgi:hypothetical protein